MKNIRMTCRNCHGRMNLEKYGADYRLTCPYCGNAEMLIGSSSVQTAQISAETERFGMSLRHQEHLDFLEESHTNRKIQIAIICIFMLIAIILTWLFMTQVT